MKNEKEVAIIKAQNMALAVNLFNMIRERSEPIPIDKIIKIADALNCSFDELLK